MAVFNGIDYAVFVVLFLSVALGIVRGFVKEIISLVAWVAAFAAATLYAVDFAGLVSGSSEESVSMVAVIASYLVIFVSVLICGAILKFIVNYAVEGTGISLLNRLFGTLFGFVRGSLIVLLAFYFLTFTSVPTHVLWQKSKMVAVFKPGVTWVHKMAMPYINILHQKLKKPMREVDEQDMSDVIKQKGMPVQIKVVPAVAPAPGSGAPDRS